MRPPVNMCLIDRTIRACISLLALGFGAFGGSYIGDPLLQSLVFIFGLLNLISFAFGWCPIYQLAGVNTTRRPQS